MARLHAKLKRCAINVLNRQRFDIDAFEARDAVGVVRLVVVGAVEVRVNPAIRTEVLVAV